MYPKTLILFLLCTLSLQGVIMINAESSVDSKPVINYLSLYSITDQTWLNTGHIIIAGKTLRIYTGVSDADTPPADLTVKISYGPSGGSLTEKTGAYFSAWDYFYYDWVIPIDAATGIYDVKVNVTDPNGGTASSSQTDMFEVVSATTPVINYIDVWGNPANQLSGISSIKIGTMLYVAERASNSTLWWLSTDLLSKTKSRLNLIQGISPTVPSIFVSDKTMYVAIDGFDNLIHWCSLDLKSGLQSSWNTLNGTSSSSPSIYVLGTAMYVIIRGSSGSLWWTTVDLTAGTQSSWQLLSGSSPSTPWFSGASGNNLNIFAIGADNIIWRCSIDVNTKIQTWSQLSDSPSLGESVYHPGEMAHIYTGISDLETQPQNLAVYISYKPRYESTWTKVSASWDPAFNGNWYLDWVIPSTAQPGPYDLRVEAYGPQGGSANSTVNGVFNIVKSYEETQANLNKTMDTVTKTESVGGNVSILKTNLNMASTLISQGGETNLSEATSIIAEVAVQTPIIMYDTIQMRSGFFFFIGISLIILLTSGLLIWYEGPNLARWILLKFRREKTIKWV